MAISSPLDITWDHAYWVEGPEFTALYGASGTGGGLTVGYMSLNAGTSSSTIDTWPDEVGTLDATQATAANKPTYDPAGISAWNNQPYVDFPAAAGGGGTNGTGLRTATFTSSVQPNEIVVIARQTATQATAGELVWGVNSVGSQSHMIQANDATHWRMYAGGTGITTGAILDTNAHVFDGQFNTTSSAFVIDGTTQASGDAGGNGFARLSIGMDGLGAVIAPQIVFVGVKLGALLTAGNRSDLVAYSQSKYGTP